MDATQALARADGALVPDHRRGRARRGRSGACGVVRRTRRDVDRAGAATLELVAAAADLGADGRDVTRVEVELDDGAVFVVREGGRTIGALDGPEADLGPRRLRPPHLRAGDRDRRAEEATLGAQAEGAVRVTKLIRLAILSHSRSGRGASSSARRGPRSAQASRTPTARPSSSSPDPPVSNDSRRSLASALRT